MNPKKLNSTIESPAPKLVTYRVTSKSNGMVLRVDAFSPEEAKRRFRDAMNLSQSRPDEMFEAIPIEG